MSEPTLLDLLDTAIHCAEEDGREVGIEDSVFARQLRAAAARLREEMAKHRDCANGFSRCPGCAALTRINGGASGRAECAVDYCAGSPIPGTNWCSVHADDSARTPSRGTR